MSSKFYKLLLAFFTELCYVIDGVICVNVGKNIRAARRNAGLTQSQLAEKINVPYQSIGQWERGTRNPKYETLEKIAAALNVHPGDLMGLKDYGDGLWAPSDISEDELEDVKVRVLRIKEDRKGLEMLNHNLQKQFLEQDERKKKIQHIFMIVESLTDDGLNEIIRLVEVIAGNPKMSTFLSFKPYFSKELSEPPQTPSLKDSETTTEDCENPPEGPTEPDKHT